MFGVNIHSLPALLSPPTKFFDATFVIPFLKFINVTAPSVEPPLGLRETIAAEVPTGVTLLLFTFGRTTPFVLFEPSVTKKVASPVQVKAKNMCM